MAVNIDSCSEECKDITPTPLESNTLLTSLNSALLPKPFRRSKAVANVDNVKSPKLGPKPKKKSSIEKLKSKAKENIRQFKYIPASGGISSDIHMYVPEAATQYIEIDDEKGEFTVKEFASQFTEKLPMQVYVSKGIYGMEDKYSLSTDDICNIHFIRRRELVQIEDKDRQLELSVPLNSAIKFGIVYNPQSNENEAMKGYLFPNISDLLSLGYCSLPKIVCACQFHDPERPLSEPSREIMVIKEVILPDNPDEFRKLRVFSTTTLRERILDENVYGHFSTRPSFMQLYLPEILKYVSNPFPCQVSMFRNPLKNEAPGVPSSMFRKIIHMKNQFTSDVLIATNILDEDKLKAADLEPFEIPTDIDVEFQVIKLSEERVKILQRNTEYLAANMDESRVKHYRYANLSEEVYRLQSSIYLAIRGHTQTEEDPDYLHPVTGNRLSLEKRVDLTEKGLKKLSINIENLKLDIDRHDVQNDYIKSWLHAIEERFTRELKQMKEDISALKCEVSEATTKTAGQTAHVHKSQDDGHTSNEKDHMTISSHQTEAEILENKMLLSNMDVEQVASLLKSIGLDVYVEVFKAECISGEILQEIDDNVLDKELGIKSTLHRIRMRHLVNGKYPQNIYVTTGNSAPK